MARFARGDFGGATAGVTGIGRAGEARRFGAAEFFEEAGRSRGGEIASRGTL